MQSSAMVLLRTFVMLGSLAAIPLVAVVGTGSWPQFLEALTQLREGTLDADSHPLDASLPLGASLPLAEPVRPAAIASPLLPVPASPNFERPLAAAAPTAAQSPEPPAGAGLFPAATANPRQPLVGDLATGNSANPPRPAFWPGSQPTAEAAHPSSLPRDNQASQVTYLETQPPLENRSQPLTAENAELWIQDRLKALGALHYRLQTAGPHGELFRFQCTMASPENPDAAQTFEVIDAQRQRAMQRLLEQVEAWLGRSPAGGPIGG